MLRVSSFHSFICCCLFDMICPSYCRLLLQLFTFEKFHGQFALCESEVSVSSCEWQHHQYYAWSNQVALAKRLGCWLLGRLLLLCSFPPGGHHQSCYYVPVHSALSKLPPNGGRQHVPQPLLNFDHAYYLLAALMWLCLHGLPCWSKYLTSVNKWSGSARWMAFFTKFNYHSWNWLGFAHMLDIMLDFNYLTAILK